MHSIAESKSVVKLIWKETEGYSGADLKYLIRDLILSEMDVESQVPIMVLLFAVVCSL